MTFENFKIEKMPDKEFRVGKISPVDLLAISTTIDFNNFKTQQVLVNFCLEHAEVKVGESWQPVKVKDKDVYQPMGIENDLPALTQVWQYMLENVIVKSFTNSSESK